MKPLLSIFLLILFYTVRSQDANKPIPVPKVEGVYYYFDQENDSIIILEKTEAEMKTKTKMGGMAGSKTSYIVSGPTSSTRIKRNDSILFVMKESAMNKMMAQHSPDPNAMYRLYKFEKGKDLRECVAMENKSGVMGIGASNSNNMDGLKIKVTRNAKDLILIVPAKALGPGEYAFLDLMSPSGASGRTQKYRAYTFGIDE